MGAFQQEPDRRDGATKEPSKLAAPRRLIVCGGAVVVLLIALAVLATAFGPTQTQTAGTHLAAATSGEQPVLLIRFSAQVTQPQISTFLDTFHAEVVSGPRRGNFYDIRIAGYPSATEVAAIVRRMQDETELVDLVAVKE